MREDLTELWTTGWVGTTPMVFKTRTNTQEPEPAAQSEHSLQTGDVMLGRLDERP